jgi:hypothetical protein
MFKVIGNFQRLGYCCHGLRVLLGVLLVGVFFGVDREIKFGFGFLRGLFDKLRDKYRLRFLNDFV